MKAGAENNSQQTLIAFMLALLATAILQVARWDWIFDRWLLFVDLGYVLPLVIGIYFVFVRDRDDTSHFDLRELALAFGMVMLPLIEQFILQNRYEVGESNEITGALCVRNLVLVLALFPRWQRISCLLGVFITMLAMTISTNLVAYVLFTVYALIGMWWLMGTYWDRLKGRFADETHRRVPIQVAVVVPTIVAMIAFGLVATIGATTTSRALWGFAPTSGGTGEYDSFARDGVNDGDAMVAAKDNAMGFGPVNSEIFLEDDTPSLYDVFNEMYGDPRKPPTNADKAQALDPNFMKANHQRLAKTKQSGREFSAIRRRGAKRRNNKLTDCDAPAMLYVVGRVPLHLRLKVFDQFDGVTWTSEVNLTRPPTVNMKKHWLTLPHNESLSRSDERHAIKFINLRTNRIPAPDQLTGVHLNMIERKDMYDWTNDGLLKMDREAVPQLTVMQLAERPLDRDSIRMRESYSELEREYAVQHQFIPQSIDTDKIAILARELTNGVPRGWQQIQAIANHLREGYEHNHEYVAPDGCNDVVSHFLFESKQGPDYMFASAAAVMLRSLGYSTRLVNGFYASLDRYDHQARQTSVLKEDAHVWTEVLVDGRTWTAIEPTPGYELLRPKPTLLQQIAGMCGSVFAWIAANIVLSATIFVCIIAAIVFRVRLIDFVSFVVWRVASAGSVERQVSWTIWLIELRARLSGNPRPATATLSNWYGDLMPQHGNRSDGTISRLLEMANVFLYSPAGLQSRSKDEIRHVCFNVATQYKLERFHEIKESID